MNLHSMNLLFNGGLLLLLGLLSGRLVNKVRLPAITGYLLVGILIGPSLLNLLTHSMLAASIWISHAALGLIAFNIGSQFTVHTLRRLGKGVLLIAVLEAFGASIIVTAVMLLAFRQPLPVSLLFGAIASATAPAATIMVIREYRAQGPLTDTLLAVVAIDDPICVMNFAIAAGIASMLLSGQVSSLGGMILRPMMEIALAIAFGVIAGLVVNLVGARLKTGAELLTFLLGVIFFVSGIALHGHLSPLLVNMALGSTVGNLSRRGQVLFDMIRSVDTPIYVAFFTLSGAGLHLELLPSIGLLGLAYVVARVVGKVLGAGIGASISGAPDKVRKYLGLGLIPQAGVALGLSLLARQQFPGIGEMISTTIVASTVIYELIGPICSKVAISLAGEAYGSDISSSGRTHLV